MATIDEIFNPIKTKRVVVGLDGFIDTIAHAVDVRSGSHYKRIDTISDFGNRIVSAAGKSANIELVPLDKKIGGNGPLLAKSLFTLGANVRYIGTLGDCEDNVFKSFAAWTNAISIGNYGETRAVEFFDGKILFGEMLPLLDASLENLLEKISKSDFTGLIDGCDAVALANWTMMPHMSAIAKFLADEILPVCSQAERVFFFDLADPGKRELSELAEFLQIIRSFEKFGHSILGLNISEAQHVLRATGEKFTIEETGEKMLWATERLQKNLQISVIFVHGLKIFSAATKEKSCLTSGYFVENPKVSTGAGDHCNGGFLAAHLCGGDIDFAANFAAATAAFFVETGRSPCVADIKILKQ
ncbi:MAG: PfkB family carbohydrate kinase [Puniceicoccales bacterium]|nr:PfkB family carbohydrate kinase [Puniceicoccales bacterium]